MGDSGKNGHIPKKIAFVSEVLLAVGKKTTKSEFPRIMKNQFIKICCPEFASPWQGIAQSPTKICVVL